MSIQLAVVPSTGSATAVNLGTLISGSAEMTLKLLTDSDPAASPVDVATVHLGDADPSTTPGFFLTPGAPTLTITCDPVLLWVSVHGEGDFVQVIAVS